jgi:hypothetical protein
MNYDNCDRGQKSSDSVNEKSPFFVIHEMDLLS